MGKLSWLKIVSIALGVAAIIALIWFAGPLISIGGSNPLDNVATRGILALLAGASAVVYLVVDVVYRTRSTAALAAGLGQQIPGAGGFSLGGGGAGAAGAGDPQAPADDSDTLKGRMSDAILTLKKTSSAKGDYLYDLPWYVIIGPPGSGKTTALVNSGLNFPLARGGATPSAIAGEGGTRYCDWWFTDDAVLIDTAGRYTTQDSDARADQSSWFSFLDLLRKNRPKQPINGVFVCISIEDLLKLPEAELRLHADAVRARLAELHERLKIDFPVYALFTKADLIAGFMEFFGPLTEEERRVVWGCTFQTNDKTANLVSSVPDEFDLLIERLNQDVVDRIQDEVPPQGKVQIFGFPSQMAALKKPVFDFLYRVFEPTRYHANATLRGFYFTSGTQEGTPIDQLVGALSRSFGTQNVGAVQYSGLGKSFFLTDLLKKVVFEEAGWVSTNLRAVRRASLFKLAGYAALLLVSAGIGTLMWLSYAYNTNLVTNAFAAVTQYKTVAGPLRDETMIADHDYARVLPALHHLRNMPTGYAQRNERSPMTGQMGLDQRPRLNAATESAYDQGLQRLLRPRLMFRLEDLMRANITNPGYLGDPLKVYLMIAGREPMDRPFVLDWMRQDFETLFPGAGNAGGRQALMEHVSHLVELDTLQGPGAIDIDNAVVQEAQSAIGRMTVADRAFELLRAAARSDSPRDWIALRKGGQDVSLVFETANSAGLDGVRVPFFYTYAGFHEAFLAKIGRVGEQVRQERRVLGDVGNQAAVVAQVENLPQALLERYSREFVAAWQTELRKLRIKPLTADKPRYLALQAAASPTSPITQLIESIRAETALTREQPAPQGQAQGQGQPAAPAAAPARIILPGGEAPGAQVEQAFRAYALIVEGDRSRRPVDELIKVLNDVYSSLTMLNDPVRSAEGRQRFGESLRTLEVTATRFPEPFKAMLQTAAASFDSDAAGTTIARLNAGVSEQVTAACQQIVNGTYPFVRTSNREISLDDFQKLFGPNGSIDRFFQANLAQYANTSGRSWVWNQASPVARRLSPAMLQSFQQASEIKAAFFPGGAPGFSFAVTNLRLADDVDVARLEINSNQLVTERPKAPAPSFSIFGSSPAPTPPPQKAPVVTFQWPGPVNLGGASLTVLPEQQGRSNVLQRPGPWGIFRLLDAVNVTTQGSEMTARMSVGGREVQYRINPVTLPNPFTLAALRSFSCPVAR
ncbi:type VI secretion system membrane subunit TssM [Bosea sp. (in: a-proteobacteria)]|uniref:type VI secretion system membrane subunit TssM n=1 Tax=Bosea sp. (in: a-proteobacteria) TaxID=1871050 RepID=UPI003B3A513E